MTTEPRTLSDEWQGFETIDVQQNQTSAFMALRLPGKTGGGGERKRGEEEERGRGERKRGEEDIGNKLPQPDNETFPIHAETISLCGRSPSTVSSE